MNKIKVKVEEKKETNDVCYWVADPCTFDYDPCCDPCCYQGVITMRFAKKIGYLFLILSFLTIAGCPPPWYYGHDGDGHYHHYHHHRQGVTTMAFDLVPYTRTAGLSLWNRLFDMPHFNMLGGSFISFPMDVNETEDMVVVEAEVPGLRAKDLDISLKGDMLTIKGEKKQERKTQNGDSYFTERMYGRFSRTIQLPSTIKSDTKIEASYKNGVIRVEIPKMDTEAIQITAKEE